MSKLVPVFVDLETYWSKDHTLTKMNPIAYCTHKETELLSIAYKFGDSPAECVVGEDNIKAWAKQVVWSNKFVIGHNLSLFDSMILRWRLGIKPKMWGCTLAMSRPLHGLTVGGSLAALVEHYGIGKKDQSAIVNTKGRHLRDFTDAEINALMEYNKADVEQCAELFKRLLPQTPKAELQVIDMTVRMLVEPKFRVDTELLSRVLCEERERKQLMLLDLATMLGTNVVGKTDEEIADDVAKTLGSSSKFAKLLHDLGVEPPMKPSPANPEKQTYALAKTDEAFIALTQHDDPMVAAAANARLGVKSTILETRIEAFLEVARCTGGRMPIAKNYYGAHTGRFSGCLVAETVIICYDPHKSATVEKRIVDVMPDDLVWDGESFVEHDGVVFSGYSEVIEWDDVIGTEDHVVFTDREEVSLSEARSRGLPIKTCPRPTEDDVEAARIYLRYNKRLFIV